MDTRDNFLKPKSEDAIQRGEKFAVSLRKKKKQELIDKIRQKRSVVQVVEKTKKLNAIEIFKQIKKAEDPRPLLADFQASLKPKKLDTLVPKLVQQGILKQLQKLMVLGCDISQILVILTSFQHEPSEISSYDKVEKSFEQPKIVFSWEMLEKKDKFSPNFLESYLGLPQNLTNTYLMLGNMTQDGISTRISLINMDQLLEIWPLLDQQDQKLMEALTWFHANLVYFEDKKEAKFIQKNSKNLDKIWDISLKILETLFNPEIVGNLLQTILNLQKLEKYVAPKSLILKFLNSDFSLTAIQILAKCNDLDLHEIYQILVFKNIWSQKIIQKNIKKMPSEVVEQNLDFNVTGEYLYQVVKTLKMYKQNPEVSHDISTHLIQKIMDQKQYGINDQKIMFQCLKIWEWLVKCHNFNFSDQIDLIITEFETRAPLSPKCDIFDIAMSVYHIQKQN